MVIAIVQKHFLSGVCSGGKERVKQPHTLLGTLSLQDPFKSFDELLYLSVNAIFFSKYLGLRGLILGSVASRSVPFMLANPRANEI